MYIETPENKRLKSSVVLRLFETMLHWQDISDI
jgi:hypothetical protein